MHYVQNVENVENVENLYKVKYFLSFRKNTQTRTVTATSSDVIIRKSYNLIFCNRGFDHGTRILALVSDFGFFGASSGPFRAVGIRFKRPRSGEYLDRFSFDFKL